MRLDFVRKEVKDYIINEVKPVYKTFDKAHSTSHFNFVTKKDHPQRMAFFCKWVRTY